MLYLVEEYVRNTYNITEMKIYKTAGECLIVFKFEKNKIVQLPNKMRFTCLKTVYLKLKLSDILSAKLKVCSKSIDQIASGDLCYNCRQLLIVFMFI